MGDGAFSSFNVSETLPGFSMDLDCMDELFLDGSWLETTNRSEFLNQGPSDPSSLYDPSSLVWPTLETGDEVRVSHSLKDNQDDMVRVLCATHNMDSVPDCTDSSDIYSVEDPESWKRLWIAPRSSPGPAYSMTDRMIRVLSYLKEFIRDKEFLAQIWMPVNRGGKLVLRTNNLPFSLGNTCARLLRYRDISIKYQFKAEEDSKELVLGLPGRVFIGKVPEWTPDVRFFKSDEYPRVDYAQQFDVRGTLALPVFERGSRTCLGVVEVVMTTQQIMYRPELESVCRALEAVNLRSSDFLSIQNKKAFRASGAVLAEIEEVLRFACEMHKLPLAQTWVACVPQGKEGCRHSTENYDSCVSTVDSACYIGDPSVQLFHEVCSEHHLLKGQGVAGRAFTTNQPCFSDDVTSFSKTDYPLSHHARVFNLRASVGIRLRSIHAGKDDYVLEFFLPTDCIDPQEQKEVLVSLSMLIQRVCHNLLVLTDEEIEEGNNLLVKEATVPMDVRSVTSAYMIELKGSDSISPSLSECKSSDTTTAKTSEPRHHRDHSNLKGCITLDEQYSTLGNVRVGKTGEKRRTKAEKTVTLQVLRQYFAGSLKDAAKSIGVCTTTLKRICRQHGIKRWPSRKIKKVGHSLQKLQRVIDSVQGTSGGFQIDSFYSKFPELASANVSGTSPFSSLKQIENSELPNMQPETGCQLNPQAAASKLPSTSCSQSSYSSHSYSSRTEQSPPPLNDGSSSKSTNFEENIEEGVLKRVRSEAEMKTSIPELLQVVPRCHIQETIDHHLKIGSMSSSKGRSKTNEIAEGPRVKVTNGDDKTRFRMQTGMSYGGLLQEIARRFNIDDMSKYTVKYLDDDTEWVLLSCDDDLQECFDICKSSKSRTIKLSLHLSNHRWRNI